MLEMLIGYAIVFLGISLLFDLHNIQEFFLAVFGQLIHWLTIPTVVLFPILVWAYYRLAKKEEEHMVKLFGSQYEEYKKRVPMFLPPLGEWKRLIDSRHSIQE